MFLPAAAGCSVRTSAFQIVDYREHGEAKRYQETFDEAYYAFADDGNVDIVLRRVTLGRSDPRHDITQVVHIRTVWRCLPGNTVAHRTQINGTVGYHIITGSVGAAFEGVGSVLFTENRRGDTLTGTLDLATLRPTRRVAGSHGLFTRAELSGEFHAKRDSRRVRRIIHETDRLLGPAPPARMPDGE